MCFGAFVMPAAPASGTDCRNGWFGLVVIRWLATLSTSTQTAIFCLYYKAVAVAVAWSPLSLHCDGNG